MTPPLVSCIIPVWNGAAFLADAIASARQQTHTPLEILVADDGSTDATPAVAASFGDAIRYIRQDNAGPAVARNRGVAGARGDYFAFLDADDLWHPERITRQLAAFAEDPGLGFSVCLIQNFWPEGTEPEGWTGHPRSLPLPGYVASGMLIPRRTFEQVGDFAPGLGHGDSTDWILRARSAGFTDRLLREALVRRRLHAESRSAIGAEASRDEFLTILKRSLDRRRSSAGSGAEAMTAAPERVSCIVPVYNGARFLLSALHSIEDQTWPHTEIIVVDDGSTDATPSLAAQAGPAVRWVRQENQGPAAARNTGLGLATCPFVAFLDADDLWTRDKLERQLARFRERPELMVCFAGIRNIRGTDAWTDDPLLDPASWPMIPFSPCTLVARKAAFDQIGPFNTTLRRGEDTEWFVRMMMRKIPYEVLPDVLLDRRIHESNLTRDQIPGPDDVVRMLKLVLDQRRAEGW